MRIELTGTPDPAPAARPLAVGWTLTLEKPGTAKAQPKVSGAAETVQPQTVRISTEMLLVRAVTLTL